MILAGVVILSGFALSQDSAIPDNAWGDWWPMAQWGRKDDAPPLDRLAAVNRHWSVVYYPEIESPWGRSQPAVSASGAIGIRFSLQLVFSGAAVRSGTVPDIKTEDLDALLFRGNAEWAKPGIPLQAMGGVGDARSFTLDLSAEFGWLPNDLEDTWIRARLKNHTFWFLLPYGIGSDPAKPPRNSEQNKAAPVRPTGAGKDDPVVVWKFINYDLGWIDPQGKVQDKAPANNAGWINVRASLSNPFDGECALELYRDSRERWSLSENRTTVAIGIPGQRVLFTRQEDVRRDDSYRRFDRFKFWRQPTDSRIWGILRVTVGEVAVERAVPGSLFLYTHGIVDHH